MKWFNHALFSLNLKNVCVGCRKFKWNVKKRSYIVPEVSKFPITSNGVLCKRCFTHIKHMTLGVPIPIHKRLVNYIKGLIIKST